MSESNLEKFIKAKVTAATFEQLPKKLGITQHKLTRICNRPEEATLEEVIRLAEILEVKATQLIDHYRMGFRHVTLNDYEQQKAA